MAITTFIDANYMLSRGYAVVVCNGTEQKKQKKPKKRKNRIVNDESRRGNPTSIDKYQPFPARD